MLGVGGLVGVVEVPSRRDEIFGEGDRGQIVLVVLDSQAKVHGQCEDLVGWRGSRGKAAYAKALRSPPNEKKRRRRYDNVEYVNIFSGGEIEVINGRSFFCPQAIDVGWQRAPFFVSVRPCFRR